MERAAADEGDYIIEIEGRVRSVGLADLDGDRLKDLVVMASPRGWVLENVPSLPEIVVKCCEAGTRTRTKSSLRFPIFWTREA